MVQKSGDHQLILREFLPLKSIIFPRVFNTSQSRGGLALGFLKHQQPSAGKRVWRSDELHRFDGYCIDQSPSLVQGKGVPSRSRKSRACWFFWVTVLTVKPGWQVIWIDAICFFPKRTFEKLIRKHGCVTCFHVFFGKHGCFFFGGILSAGSVFF